MTLLQIYLLSLLVNFITFPILGFTLTMVSGSRGGARKIKDNLDVLSLYKNNYSRLKDFVRMLTPLAVPVYAMYIVIKGKFTIMGILQTMLDIRMADWETVKKFKTKRANK